MYYLVEQKKLHLQQSSDTNMQDASENITAYCESVRSYSDN